MQHAAAGSALRRVALRCGLRFLPGRAGFAARTAFPSGARTHQALREQSGAQSNHRKDEQGDEHDQLTVHMWTRGLDACAESGAMHRAITPT